MHDTYVQILIHSEPNLIICCLLRYCLSNEKLNSIATYYKQEIWWVSHLNLTTSNLTQCDTTLTAYHLCITAHSCCNNINTQRSHHLKPASPGMNCMVHLLLYPHKKQLCSPNSSKYEAIYSGASIWTLAEKYSVFLCPQFEWCPLTICTISSTKYKTIRYQNHKLNSAAALNYSRHDFFLE